MPRTPKLESLAPQRRQVGLATDGDRLAIYAKLETLARGESITVWSPEEGADGRSWCRGFLSWLLWERKRRLCAAQLGGNILTDAGAREIDRLFRAHSTMVESEEGRFGLRFLHEPPIEFEMQGADGEVTKGVL